MIMAARDRRPVVLEAGRVLVRSDLTGRLEQRDEPVGEVVEHPTTGEPAIRNRSAAPWYLLRDGARPTIPPGAAVLLRDDQQIQIDGVVFRIRVPR